VVRTLSRWVVSVAAMILVSSTRAASLVVPWRVYMHDGERFVSAAPLVDGTLGELARHDRVPGSLAPLGEVISSALADVTGDGRPEWVVLVWRPWQDWPIQDWVRAPSPISDFHDALGESCAVVLVDPRSGHEIWAGSALPVALVAMEVGDVDGDGVDEVVTLEGEYAIGRDGPAQHLVVWSWGGFGFGLDWRSESINATELRLLRDTRGSIVAVGVR
jgi:hypothetical protein